MSSTTPTPTPTAHPVPSDAELVKLAYEAICDMEEPLYEIRDYANALCLMANASIPQNVSSAVIRIGICLEAVRDALEEERGKLFHALHPRRGEPGFSDDDDGEVDEAEGDAL